MQLPGVLAKGSTYIPRLSVHTFIVNSHDLNAASNTLPFFTQDPPEMNLRSQKPRIEPESSSNDTFTNPDAP